MQTFRWTSEAIQYLREQAKSGLYSATDIAEQISAKFNIECTRNMVIGKANREKIPLRKGGINPKTGKPYDFWNAERRKLLNELWDKNLPVADIGYQLQCSSSSIARAAKTFGLPERDKHTVCRASSKEKAIITSDKTKELTGNWWEKINYWHHPNPKKLTLVQLTSRSCRYIVGEPRLSSYKYCGADVPLNSPTPYCEYCVKVMYVPRKEKRK